MFRRMGNGWSFLIILYVTEGGFGTRVAIYCRVSTSDKGQDIDMQRTDLLAYCRPANGDPS